VLTARRSREQREHLVLLGEAPLALLGEDELAVGDHVELAVRALVRGRVDALSLEPGRETRGPSVVAPSDGAVVNLDRHAPSLSREAPSGDG
jgi:hypothetical protein